MGVKQGGVLPPIFFTLYMDEKKNLYNISSMYNVNLVVM